MKCKSIDVLKGGEVLAEPIVSQRQDTIIPRGTVIKTEYIPLIMSMGIESVMIEDPYEDYVTPNPIIENPQFDYFVERIKGIMENHIYQSNGTLREFEMIANEIIKKMVELPNDIVIDVTERKPNLYEHTIMVTLLSVFIGKRLHLDKKRLYNLALGSLLHDIGIRYITVPYESVDPKAVDPVAMFELKKHTILGYSALDGENWIPDISRKMILSHHERIDGSGYPMRQKNKEMEIRIIQVCDLFDCCISGMEGKRQSLQDTLRILAERAGIGLDKKVVEQLLDIVALYPVGTQIKTSDETQAVVIAQTAEKNSPIIMIVDEKEQKYQQKNLMLEKDISISGIM